MSRPRLFLLIIGVPGLMVYGTLVAAQWWEGMALSAFQALEKANPPSSLHPIESGSLEKKIAALRRASRMAPSDPEPAYQEALLRLVDAEGRSLSPAAPGAELSGGPDQHLVPLLQQGLRAVRRAIHLNPGSAEYHYLEALILQNLLSEPSIPPGSTPRETLVNVHLRNSGWLDPYKPSLRYRVGAFEMALGNRQEARSAFSVALEQDPTLAKPIFATLWSTTSSVVELRSFVKHDPRVCVLLGEFLMEQGSRSEALAEYDEAAARGGSDFQVISGLLRLYFRQQAYNKVLDLVSRVERAGHIYEPGQRAILRFSAGQAYFNKGDLDAAISAYEDALRLDDTRLHIHHSLAQAFLRRGDYSKAIARWTFVLSSDAGRSQLGAGVESAHLGLAQAYEKQGRYAEALAEYLRVTKMNPNNGTASLKIREISREL